MTQAPSQLEVNHTALADKLVMHAGQRMREDEVRALQHALRIAQFAFRDRRRDSGETYFEHCVAVAQIALDYNLDPETIIAAVLHNILESTDVSLEQIEETFGGGVARMVDGMSRLASLPEKAREERQAENLRKLILATSTDMRVMLLQLADRLHNMRTLHKFPPARQQLIANETLEIYAPIAGRLGISRMKAELEDLAFKIANPEGFEEIDAKLSASQTEQQKRLDEIQQRLLVELRRVNVSIDRSAITSRQKHIYSIYRKLQTQKYYGQDVWRIYDRLGVRVVVPTIPDCYLTLGVVHSLWKAVPNEFDDYISNPRPTGYRSLHTAVQCNPDDPREIVEIQIRTPEMHEEAEYGIAAHWRYKEGGRRDIEFENRIAWLRQLLELGTELTDAQEFVDAMKTDIFADRVYVFSPREDIFDLPAGSTPIDFAYHVHTDIGHRCRGARVNGKLVSLDHKLQTGDKVEIITARRGGPSRDWLTPSLGYVKTRRAATKIRQWFRRQDREKMIAQGREAVEREIKRVSATSVTYEEVAALFNLSSAEDLFAAVGFGDISTESIATKILEAERRKQPDELLLPTTQAAPTVPRPAEGIDIMGTAGLLVHLARCCSPVEGEPIVGFITRGRGVTVHRADCPNVINASERERLINVSWGAPSEQRYQVPVVIAAYNREGLLRDIAAAVADGHMSMTNISTSTKDNVITFHVTMEIADLTQLGRVLHKIQQIPNVIEARRRASG